MARSRVFDCDYCGARVALVPCFDRSPRLFDVKPVALRDDPKRPTWDRWVLDRTMGMRSGSDVPTEPTTYYVLHRCLRQRRGYGDEQLAAHTDSRWRGGMPTDLHEDFRIGYRWLAGPAHITRKATGLGLCGQNGDFGTTERELARAQQMVACDLCLRMYPNVLKSYEHFSPPDADS